ncbi:hypothetical protein FRB90_000202 [Tulasnella sp. 427]|nr:hypothetical protein FRB90_000202 [Tulasnella sp. 427]
MSAHPSSSNSELIFYGTDGIEAEEFIRSVKKAARAAGKLRDNDWIVDEVSVALAGDALRWYIDLDEETQSDWTRLQRAIVRQYPRKVAPIPASSASEPATIPTPAAAVSHPLAAAAATVTEQRFYIRIAFRHKARSAYVMIRDGYLAPTSNRSEAIQVRHDPEMERLLVTNGVRGLNPLQYIAETKQVILAFLNYPISQSNISPQRMELLVCLDVFAARSRR